MNLQGVEDCQKEQLRGVAQLVAHLVWDQGVAGSNPVTPTTERQKRQSRGVVSRPGWCESPEQIKTVIRGVAQLVAHLVWDQGVAGSNPVTPTKENSLKKLREFFVCIHLKKASKDGKVI